VFGDTHTPLAVGECFACGELAVSCCVVVCYMFSTEDLYYRPDAHNVSRTCCSKVRHHIAVFCCAHMAACRGSFEGCC
jgi:hypothetical protein